MRLIPNKKITHSNDSRLSMKKGQQLTLTYEGKQDTVVALKKGELVYFLEFPANASAAQFSIYSDMVHTFNLR